MDYQNNRWSEASLVSPDNYADNQITHYLMGDVYLPNYQKITVKVKLKLQKRYFTSFFRTDYFLKRVEGRLLYQKETDHCVMKEKFGVNRRIRILDSTSF